MLPTCLCICNKHHISIPFQAAATGGMRLSDLMPQHAIHGGSAPLGSSPGNLRSGGPGGPTDPWKALLVSWDAGTMLGWPARVSPWEVRGWLFPTLDTPFRMHVKACKHNECRQLLQYALSLCSNVFSDIMSYHMLTEALQSHCLLPKTSRFARCDLTPASPALH